MILEDYAAFGDSGPRGGGWDCVVERVLLGRRGQEGEVGAEKGGWLLGRGAGFLVCQFSVWSMGVFWWYSALLVWTYASDIHIRTMKGVLTRAG